MKDEKPKEQRCGDCVHFDLKRSGLAVHGYGNCLARPEQVRAAHYTSDENLCRTGKFEAGRGPR